MIKTNKNFFLLHFIVFIWGFTGILGHLISLESQNLVWCRILIAALSILIYIKLSNISLKINTSQFFRFTLTGIIIALHWIFFFESIKISNISVTLACLSAATLFTALLEPLLHKKRIISYEIVLGFAVIVGLGLIFNFESKYQKGILYTLFSALMSSLFTVINGKLVKQETPEKIAFFEMCGGLAIVTIYLLISNSFQANAFQFNLNDIIYLLILGTVCTAFALIASISIMKELSPFTVTMTTNLEPVYGIIMAYLFFGENEKMSLGFYLGTLIILTSIFFNAYLKSRHNQTSELKKS
jgi:drug/metabolite transporter (DMT)-like permease